MPINEHSVADVTVAIGATNNVFTDAVIRHNPVWAQLLGLCPLLAVSSTVINAVGLAFASALVVVGSNVMISTLRNVIPEQARLPCFVLIIATFTTITTLILEAFAYDLYLKIALFVQIIVTNCMILGRAETFASRQRVSAACLDALGTAIGFAIALIGLGTVREVLGQGTLLRDAHLLFGPGALDWQISIWDSAPLPVASYAPGAFIVAALLFAGVRAAYLKLRPHNTDTPQSAS